MGSESIGLPIVRSVDTVLESYLRLLDRTRRGTALDLRHDDLRTLAEAIGVKAGTVENRLLNLRATV